MQSSTKNTSKSDTTTYQIVRNRPVAKFKYKGSHSKPIRRTVILTEVTRDVIRGYEVREGNETRDLGDEVIKSFARSKVEGLERFAMSEDANW